MRPDDVAEKWASEGVTIRVSDLEDLVLIEGTKGALLLLAELLTAVAEEGRAGFQISPTGAGMALFSEGSTRGFYFLRKDGNK